MRKVCLAIVLAFFSISSYCKYDAYWLEASGGLEYGETYKFKIRDDYKGWALIYSRYSEDEFLGNSHVDRNTLDKIEPEFRVYGISRFVSAPFKWGNADVGIGLGYGHGDWSENCKANDEGLFGTTTEQCELKSGSSIGIPVHASATLGRYVGVGVNIDVFFSYKLDPMVQVGLVIPLGLFAK